MVLKDAHPNSTKQRTFNHLTIVLFLAAFPEAGVEISKGKLVLPRLPDVVNRIGQLPLPDLGQLLSSGWRKSAVERVLSGTLCEERHKGTVVRKLFFKAFFFCTFMFLFIYLFICIILFSFSHCIYNSVKDTLPVWSFILTRLMSQRLLQAGSRPKSCHY